MSSSRLLRAVAHQISRLRPDLPGMRWFRRPIRTSAIVRQSQHPRVRQYRRLSCSSSSTSVFQLQTTRLSGSECVACLFVANGCKATASERRIALVRERPISASVTRPSLSSNSSTCRNCLSCRGRLPRSRRRLRFRYEPYPACAHSNCRHGLKMARRPPQRLVHGDLSQTGAQYARGYSDQVSSGPTSGVGCLAGHHSAGIDIRTDQVDRTGPAVERERQQRDGARPACPSPLDTRCPCSESIPRDTSRRAVFRRLLQIVARTNDEA